MVISVSRLASIPNSLQPHLGHVNSVMPCFFIIGVATCARVFENPRVGWTKCWLTFLLPSDLEL